MGLICHKRNLNFLKNTITLKTITQNRKATNFCSKTQNNSNIVNEITTFLNQKNWESLLPLVSNKLSPDVVHSVITKQGLKPDHFAYTALIDGFMRQGDSGEAFQVKEEMLARGVKLNLFTYNALVKGVCKFGDMEKANALLNEMIMVGIKPDTQTYNNIIEGYLKEQNTSRVKDLLSEMKKRNLVPTAYTCGMIINGLCRHGSIEDASRVFEIMVSLGVKPNAVIYTTLIKGREISRGSENFKGNG
ncbi:hypothetical protein NC651_034173 [Populus alba x Populus x berolinensis]|nr:hypothetical protein NC651_034173 [Populus alba x Populus x berolinensis]